MQKMLFGVVYGLIILAASIQLSLQPKRKCKCEVGILEEVKVLPRNEWEFVEFTKNLTCQCDCSNGEERTYLHYVPSSTLNKTYIMCDYKQPVFGYCLEFNEGGGKMQSSIERCTEYKRSPCNSTYWSTNNYVNFECFEKFGGLLTPMEQVEQVQALKNNSTTCSRQLQAQRNNFITCSRQLQTQKNENGDFKIAIVIFLSLSILGNVIVCFCYWRDTCRKTRSSKHVTEESLSSDKSSNDTTSDESETSFYQTKQLVNDEQATSEGITVSEETPLSKTSNFDKTFLNIGEKKAPIRKEELQATFDKQNN